MALADSIIAAESGGDPNASNPNSSAVGAGQFTAPTWLDTISKHRPDLVQGKSDDEILGLRSDPQLSAEMTGAYAQDNQAVLSKAGVPVTPGSTYLAHFAGPAGAVKVLQADPNASVEDVLGSSVVKANPFLKGMTAQGLQAWAAKKMGVTSPIASAAPQAPGAPTSILPQQPAPIFPQQQAQAQPQAQPQQAEAAPQQFQAPQMNMPPIFFAPRKPVNISQLRASFSAPTFYGKS